MKFEFNSQRIEVHSFLTTNMAAVTSYANQQYKLITYTQLILQDLFKVLWLN